MNCPRCGVQQPFEVKCVRCETDIAATFKSEKSRLNTYRALSILLFCALVLVGIQNFFAAAPSKQPGEEGVETAKPAATPRDRTRTSSDEGTATQSAAADVTGLAVPVFVQKTNFVSYKMLEGFREFFPGKMDIRPWDGDTEIDEDTVKVVVAIGDEAADHLNEFPKNTPVVVLSAQNERFSQVNRDNTVILPPTLSKNQEVAVIHKLFPQVTRIVLVTNQNDWKPSDTLQQDLNLKITLLSPDAVTLERELEAQRDQSPLVWLHQMTAKEAKAIVSRSLSERYLTLVWRPLESSSTASPTLVELSPSARGLGAQAALLLPRIIQKSTLSESDLSPTAAIQVTLHFSKAMALGREDLVENLRNITGSTGYDFRLLP